MASMRCIVLSAIAALLVWASAGCQAGPPQFRSPLAGQWHGQVLTRSTQARQALLEDFTVTILANGRFAWVGLTPGGQIERAGQRLGPAGLPPCRVLRADYRADESHVVLEFRPPEASGVGRAGAAASAKLLADGRLEFRLFTFSMCADAGDCDAVAQWGLLRRVEAAPASRPDQDAR